MVFVYIILIVSVLMLIYMYFEAGWVEVKRVDFSRSMKCLKVIHISDIHINKLRVPAWKVRKIIKKENPDIIIISGDYIEKPINASHFLEFLQEIKQNYKTYLCLGNHDYKAFAGNKQGLETFIKEIEALQVKVLKNDSVQFEKNSFKYNLISFDDIKEGTPNISKAVEKCSPAITNIAFTHNPDLILQLSRKNVDYLFCGHTHGGQIWMPFNLEFALLRKDKLCKMGYKKGLHKIRGINLYINRGLGNVVVPLRFLSRPEITVYKIP